MNLAITVAAILTHLNEIEEYFDNRSDVVDGDYGAPSPNVEMRLLQEVRDAIKLVEAMQ